jgi:hypothetical protein
MALSPVAWGEDGVPARLFPTESTAFRIRRARRRCKTFLPTPALGDRELGEAVEFAGGKIADQAAYR